MSRCTIAIHIAAARMRIVGEAVVFVAFAALAWMLVAAVRCAVTAETTAIARLS